jgi:tripartite-type tricarboxylate transporter receptor subunit TctC
MKQRDPIRMAALLVALTLFMVACAPSAQPGASAPRANSTAAPAAATGPAMAPAPAALPAERPAEAAGSVAALTDAERREVEAFYSGKTVKVIVGFAAGGGYDVLARLTAKYLSHYLPGSPTVVVENMVGAGSLIAANHLYNAAPKDGTVIATIDPGLVLIQAVGGGSGGAQFESAQFGWLGAPITSTVVCFIRPDTGVDSMEKLLAAPREVVFGATSLGNSTSVLGSILQQTAGAKVRIVTGYDGVAKIKLAVESGEADALCGAWESLKSVLSAWLSGSPPVATVVVKGKADPLGELQAVPLLSEYLPTEEARQVLAVAMAPQAMGFPYTAPPGVPAARLKALRGAVYQVWNDPEFQAESMKAQFIPFPQDYQVMEQLVKEVVSSPPATLRLAKDVLGIQ